MQAKEIKDASYMFKMRNKVRAEYKDIIHIYKTVRFSLVLHTMFELVLLSSTHDVRTGPPQFNTQCSNWSSLVQHTMFELDLLSSTHNVRTGPPEFNTQCSNWTSWIEFNLYSQFNQFCVNEFSTHHLYKTFINQFYDRLVRPA